MCPARHPGGAPELSGWAAGLRHQWLFSRLAVALGTAVPVGFEVLKAINVRVGPGKILIPDLAVVSTPGLDLTVCEAADVGLVVEITSPGDAVTDRAIKPQLYAQASIPHYLLTEPIVVTLDLTALAAAVRPSPRSD